MSIKEVIYTVKRLHNPEHNYSFDSYYGVSTDIDNKELTDFLQSKKDLEINGWQFVIFENNILNFSKECNEKKVVQYLDGFREIGFPFSLCAPPKDDFEIEKDGVIFSIFLDEKEYTLFLGLPLKVEEPEKYFIKF